MAGNQGCLGDTKAIADSYFKGSDVKQNYKEAFKWYKKMEEQGRCLWGSKYRRYVLQWIWGKKDYAKALEHYNIAAEKEIHVHSIILE